MNVLICDGDSLECAELERGFCVDGRSWNVTSVGDADEALALLGAHSFDVVLAECWMADDEGKSLLACTRDMCPGALRIGLAAHSDRRGALRCTGVAHQMLPKPCDPIEAAEAIARSQATREVLHSEPLREVIAGIDKLPSAPGLYGRLLAEIQSAEPSVSRVAEIITSDPAMVAKVLQLVNSAFFGFRWRVNTIHEAVALIGLRMVKDLVLSVQVFSRYEGVRVGDQTMDALVGHSLTVANFAKIIALAEKADRTVVGDSFLGGILHDVGKLVLADQWTRRYGKIIETAQRKGAPLWRQEEEELGVTHAEVGAYLLALWGLSDGIVEAVAFHHRPQASATMRFVPLTAIHVGNLLAHDAMVRAQDQVSHAPVSSQFLGRQNLMGRMEVWQFNCEQIAYEGD